MRTSFTILCNGPERPEAVIALIAETDQDRALLRLMHLETPTFYLETEGDQESLAATLQIGRKE